MGLLDLFSDSFREPAECVIKVDGEEITDFYPFLTEVTADSGRQISTEATLRFEIRRDEHGRWTVLDDEVFIPWAPIVIEAAFGSRTEEVMRGYVRQVDVDYPEQQNAATLTVQCRDESLRLDREHVRVVWGTEEEPVSDEDIVQQIADKYGLSPDPDNGAGQSELVQQNQDSTDIAYLRRRAEANGYELLFEAGHVYFGPMRLDAEPQPTINVYAGQSTNCLRFSTRFDGHQPDQVAFELAEPDGAGVTEVVVEPDLPLLGTRSADSGAAGLEAFTWRMSKEGGRNEEELTALAQRKANEFALKLNAEGELDGTLYGYVLRVGLPVRVDGVGESMGGVYYVDEVNHRFDAEGYRQAFRLLRNAYGDDA